MPGFKLDKRKHVELSHTHTLFILSVANQQIPADLSPVSPTLGGSGHCGAPARGEGLFPSWAALFYSVVAILLFSSQSMVQDPLLYLLSLHIKLLAINTCSPGWWS